MALPSKRESGLGEEHPGRCKSTFFDTPWISPPFWATGKWARLSEERANRTRLPCRAEKKKKTPANSRLASAQVYLEVNAVPIPGTDGVKTLVPYRSMDGAAKQFDAPDTPGYQFAQNRGLVVMETAVGLVAILPMGMAQVSSVMLTAEEGVTLTKGEEISYFQFGGSDIVMVFQRQSNVNITAKEGTHNKMGTVLGYAYPAGK